MKLSFGVSLSTSAAVDADPIRDARHIDDLGFDFLTVSDHPSGAHPTYETWTLLTWAAASTSRVALVTNVLAVPWRAPPLLAKMAESLDRLSGCRFTLGLGAGGNDSAFRAFGFPALSAGKKVEALADAIEIMRGMWQYGQFTYTGSQYRVEDAQIEPRAERPIPIWIGAYRPRALELTGRVANGWSPSLPYAPPEHIPEMRGRILQAAVDAGRSPDAITCNYNMSVMIGDRVSNHGRSLAGPPAQIAERIAQYAGLGFTSFSLWPMGDEREQRERLAHEVIPAVRALI